MTLSQITVFWFGWCIVSMLVDLWLYRKINWYEIRGATSLFTAMAIWAWLSSKWF